MAGFRYLLDTNILSHLIRHPQGQVRKHLDRAVVLIGEVYKFNPMD